MLLLFRLAVGARIPDLISDTLVAPPYCTPGDGATAGDCGPPAIVSWVATYSPIMAGELDVTSAMVTVSLPEVSAYAPDPP